jgi:preprotein translocase subunit SecA
LQPGEAIVHPWINKALEKAQKKVEARNFDMRKNVLKYDDVMNAQRKEVYAQRKEFMRTPDVAETIADMRDEVLAAMVRLRIPEKGLAENWGLSELAADLQRTLGVALPIEEWGRTEGMDETGLEERVMHAAAELTADKERRFGAETMRFVEKSILIQTLDTVWKEHLYALDHLRQGIGLRAYGQRDPLNEYKSEAFVLFNFMLDELKQRVTAMLSRVEVAHEQPAPPPPFSGPQMHELHPDPNAGYDPVGDVGVLEPSWSDQGIMLGTSRLASDAVDPTNPSTWGTVGRNASCPCGSGKKYKFCHGRVT